MISVLDRILAFCDGFPILSIVIIPVCILASFPAIVLFIAIQRTAVHANCRFLMSLWAVSLCQVLLSVTILYSHMFTFIDGYLPRGIISPPARVYLLWMHGTIYFASSSFEMFIVLERMISTRQPHEYHESKRATKILILSAISAYAFGTWSGYFLFIRGPRALGLFLHNLIDFLTLVMNTVGIQYSKTRFNNLYGKATLTARYQVKEAYLMAKAMNPVYLVSFLIKLTGTVVGYIYVLFLCCEDSRYFVFVDFSYYTFHIANCIFSSTFLIFKHASIRKSARSLFIKEEWVKEASLRNRWLFIRENRSGDIVNGARTSETTNAYFAMLQQSWQ